jgi:hypothetical protein
VLPGPGGQIRIGVDDKRRHVVGQGPEPGPLPVQDSNPLPGDHDVPGLKVAVKNELSRCPGRPFSQELEGRRQFRPLGFQPQVPAQKGIPEVLGLVAPHHEAVIPLGLAGPPGVKAFRPFDLKSEQDLQGRLVVVKRSPLPVVFLQTQVSQILQHEPPPHRIETVDLGKRDALGPEVPADLQVGPVFAIRIGILGRVPHGHITGLRLRCVNAPEETGGSVPRYGTGRPVRQRVPELPEERLHPGCHRHTPSVVFLSHHAGCPLS